MPRASTPSRSETALRGSGYLVMGPLAAAQVVGFRKSTIESTLLNRIQQKEDQADRRCRRASIPGGRGWGSVVRGYIHTYKGPVMVRAVQMGRWRRILKAVIESYQSSHASWPTGWLADLFVVARRALDLCKRARLPLLRWRPPRSVSSGADQGSVSGQRPEWKWLFSCLDPISQRNRGVGGYVRISRVPWPTINVTIGHRRDGRANFFFDISMDGVHDDVYISAEVGQETVGAFTSRAHGPPRNGKG